MHERGGLEVKIMYEGLEKLANIGMIAEKDKVAFDIDKLKEKMRATGTALESKKDIIIPAGAGGVGAGVGVLGYQISKAKSLKNLLRKKQILRPPNGFLQKINEILMPPVLRKANQSYLQGLANKHNKIFGATPIGRIVRTLGVGAAVGIPAYLGVRAFMNRKKKN